MKPLEARALRTLGRINMKRRSGYVQAEANLRQSLLLTEQIKADYEKALSLLYLAELWSKEGIDKDRRHECKAVIGQAKAIFRRMGVKSDLSKALQLQDIL